MNIYIDTSAYVKEYHDEPGSELVHSVFESAKNGDALLITSLWTISEAVNTIDRHFMRHELNKEEFNKVLGAIFTDMFEMLDNKNLKIVDIDTNLVKISWEYISSEHLSAADSLHLVTAMKSNADVFYFFNQCRKNRCRIQKTR
ncbi:twitching motility protein PilT [groundwater metagenome]